MSRGPYRQFSFLAAPAPHSPSRPSPFVSTTLLNIYCIGARHATSLGRKSQKSKKNPFSGISTLPPTRENKKIKLSEKIVQTSFGLPWCRVDSNMGCLCTAHATVEIRLKQYINDSPKLFTEYLLLLFITPSKGALNYYLVFNGLDFPLPNVACASMRTRAQATGTIEAWSHLMTGSLQLRALIIPCGDLCLTATACGVSVEVEAFNNLTWEMSVILMSLIAIMFITFLVGSL